MLKRRWRQSHAETGYLPDGSSTGKTLIDHHEKFRIDHFIYRGSLNDRLSAKLRQLLRPLGFRGGQLEWFRIGCYSRGGHFRLHRDDTSKDIAGRKFSLVVPLSEPHSYVGGVLKFPELNLSLKPVAGTAVIFSAHLLHGVMPVKQGKRFALITFANQD